IDALPGGVIFAPDISFYRKRKLRLLNGAHTAMAPLALLAGVRTVREATEHPRLGAFLRHILFEEIVPGIDLPADAAAAFARTVIDRFRNPWLEHEWRVIATNQTAKLRLRVVPAIVGFARKQGRAPQGLALGCAAYLRWVRSRLAHPAGEDVDLPLIERHWRAVDPDAAPGPVLATALERLAARALADAGLWGANLTELPGLRAAARALVAGGVGALEITLTTPGAIEALGDLASDRDLAACLIGAGTVLDESAAREVIDAGARFVVSPTLTTAVIRVCRDR